MNHSPNLESELYPLPEDTEGSSADDHSIFFQRLIGSDDNYQLEGSGFSIINFHTSDMNKTDNNVTEAAPIIEDPFESEDDIWWSVCKIVTKFEKQQRQLDTEL